MVEVVELLNIKEFYYLALSSPFLIDSIVSTKLDWNINMDKVHLIHVHDVGLIG